MKSIHCLIALFAFTMITTSVAKDAADFPAPIAKVLKQIEAFVGDSYDWEFVPELPDAAMSATGGRISINPNMWARYSPYAIFFTILHEIGHQELGHVDPDNQRARSQPWMKPKFELEADAYASEKMSESGIVDAKILRAAQELFAGSPGDRTHPSGAERIANVSRTLGL